MNSDDNGLRGELIMSVLLIKLLACFAMLLDHVGRVFGWEGWDMLPSGTVDMMRYIGRFVFPVFAFLIVNGWGHTKNKQRYFSNLILFAMISQIPFTLGFYLVNLEKVSADTSANYFTPPLTIFIYLLLSAVFVFTYWYFALKKKKSISMVWVGLATILPGVLLKINHIWILYHELNVIYTLALGMFAIFCYEKVVLKHGYKWYEYALLIFTFTMALLAIGTSSEYGIMGVVLILGLYITRKNRIAQVLVICVWGSILYGAMYGNWYNALATIIGSILILLYNGKKGADIKYLFYVFYPAHILILGIINIVFKFG